MFPAAGGPLRPGRRSGASVPLAAQSVSPGDRSVCPGPARGYAASVTEDGAARRERRRAAARQRAEELGERIAGLAKRRGEMGARLSATRGSGAEQVQAAWQNVDRARRSAVVAAELAATAAESSADVHERAASPQDQLAEGNHGDPQ